MTWTEEHLRDEFNRDFEALCNDHTRMTIRLTPLQLWTVFSLLQLALRHPKTAASPTAKIGRYVAHHLQALVATTPAPAEIAHRGWDPQYDQ